MNRGDSRFESKLKCEICQRKFVRVVVGTQDLVPQKLRKEMANPMLVEHGIDWSAGKKQG